MTDANLDLDAWWHPEPLQELISVMGGNLCAEMSVGPGLNPASIFNSLHNSGMVVVSWQTSKKGEGKDRTLRFVASRG